VAEEDLTISIETAVLLGYAAVCRNTQASQRIVDDVSGQLGGSVVLIHFGVLLANDAGDGCATPMPGQSTRSHSRTEPPLAMNERDNSPDLAT